LVEWENMNIKQFFKPRGIKIVLLLIFLVLSFFKTNHPLSSDSTSFSHGFPLYYLNEGYNWWSFTDDWKSHREIFNISYLNFFADLVFWYVVSCFIVWIYDKFKKKPQ